MAVVSILIATSLLAIFGDREGSVENLSDNTYVQNSTRLLFYVTTHASPAHLWFWKHRWAQQPRQDIFVYFTAKNVSSDWFTTVPLVGYSKKMNPGYQQGAIQAMHDSAILRAMDVTAYDWIV